MKPIESETMPEEGTPMWELWKRADVMLVAAGSIPCIRELYILAKRLHRLHQLYYVVSSNEDYALGNVEDKIRAALLTAGRKPGVHLVILYLSCPDILIRIDFDDLEKTMSEVLGKPVRCYFRGPLGKEESRYEPIEDFMKHLPEEKGEAAETVDQLMPPIADMAAVSDWMRWKKQGNIIVTPSGCRSCMADADMDPAQQDIYYTEIKKDDVIFGIDGATEKQVDDLMEEEPYNGYSLIGTAVPAMIGMDGAGIVKGAAEKGHRGLYFPCDGFQDGMVGVAEAERIVAKSAAGGWGHTPQQPLYASEGFRVSGSGEATQKPETGNLKPTEEVSLKEKTPQSTNGVVQIFGYSPMISGDIHQFDDCLAWLRDNGFTPRFTGMDGIPDKPVVSWVVSSAGLPAARFLLDQFQIPMVTAAPLGHHAMESWQKNIRDLAAGKDRERMLKIHNMNLPKTREEHILFLGEPVQIMAAAHYFRHAGFYHLKLLCYAWNSEDKALYEKAPGGREWFTLISTKEELRPYWDEADLVVADEAFLDIMGDKPHISLNTGFFSGREALAGGSGVLGKTFREAVEAYMGDAD